MMKKMHRKGRGPKAAIRRYLGGDGESVGPGIFHLVPSALLRVKRTTESRRIRNTGNGKQESLWSLIQTVHGFLREEGKNTGYVIRLCAPWHGAVSFSPPILGASMEDAVRQSLMWSRYLELDPIPPDFKEDAQLRIKLIRMIIEGMRERDHVS